MIVRLNKYLASAGVAARRKCDDLIKAGRIKVNDEVIRQVGVRIDDQNDVVMFDNIIVSREKEFIYILLNKPKGFVTTVKDEFKRNTVIDLIPVEERIFPVGRLDYESTGVLILTNDGELNNRLIHPRYKIEKTYHVLLDRHIRPVDLYQVQRGMELDGEKTLPCKASEIRIVDNCSLLEIIIREGKNRQIRRMAEKLNYKVQELDRIAFGPITLAGLRRGDWRYLNDSELESLKLSTANQV